MAHVMIVDDDRATVSLLSMLLEMDGFQVSQSPQPQGVLERGKAGGVDAFIIDCHLGSHSGLSLVREIRGDADLVNKLVVVTSGRDVADEAEDAGADLFMLKPFSPNELSAKLSGLLAESRNS
jgi:DNA-binding response OmpR family regulator